MRTAHVYNATYIESAKSIRFDINWLSSNVLIEDDLKKRSSIRRQYSKKHFLNYCLTCKLKICSNKSMLFVSIKTYIKKKKKK